MTWRTEPASSSKGVALGCLAFGAYLLAGAFYAFARGKWPWFMLPLLDIFAFLISLFGERASGYIGGGLLGLLGLASVALGVALLVRLRRIEKNGAPDIAP